MLTLTGLFAHPTNPSSDYPMKTQITPYIAMAPFDLPIPIEPILAMILPYFDIANILITEHFWDVFMGVLVYFGGYLPVALTGLMIFEALLMFPLFVILFGINGPICAVLIVYWLTVYTTVQGFLGGGEEEKVSSTIKSSYWSSHSEPVADIFI